MSLAPGAHLGPYEILCTIGARGMGEVYKARDTRLDRIVLICAALTALGLGVARAQIPVAETRAQVIQYADGRVVSTVLQPKGSMWTPKFPQIPGIETSRSGRALYALDVAHVVEGPDVRFTVSLWYGKGFDERVWVADVRVTAEQPVRVEALRAYGVEPITLSLIVVPPTLTLAPAVVNSSSLLEVRVEAIAPHVPVYRVALTNHSTRALLAIQFAFYRGDDVVLSGRRRAERNEPLVEPGREYGFEVPISRGNSDTWATIDRAVISSIMWDDGLIEGDPAPAEQERMIREGRAISIRQVLALLRSAHQLSLSEFRSKFAGMRLFDPIMQRIRDAALAHFDELAGGNREAIRAWLTEQITEYEAWLGRVVGTSP